jgi:hypothetical protein
MYTHIENNGKASFVLKKNKWRTMIKRIEDGLKYMNSK